MPELPDLRKRPDIQARHVPNDYAERRNDYAAFGIPEYWRFDPTGGEYYETGLAGDRLVDGVYQPITIVHTDETHHWGHSEVLNLGICWEDGQLRFWDPVEKRYLRTHQEEKHDRITAEAQADAAEARMKELEEELRAAGNGNPETSSTSWTPEPHVRYERPIKHPTRASAPSPSFLPGVTVPSKERFTVSHEGMREQLAGRAPW